MAAELKDCRVRTSSSQFLLLQGMFASLIDVRCTVPTGVCGVPSMLPCGVTAALLRRRPRFDGIADSVGREWILELCHHTRLVSHTAPGHSSPSPDC